MTNAQIGRKLVDLCKAGKALEAVDTLYDEKIVSIEAQGSDGMPARTEGIEAVRGNNKSWYDRHEVHSAKAVGPFCGHRDDQFAVLFETDVTDKTSGNRLQLTEVALYTVRGGKVVQEEFLYLR
jgi:hypothetical protein